MSRYDSGFKEPPWVIGSSKETMDWIESSHPSKKEKKSHAYKDKYLTDLHLKFDFYNEKRIVKSSCMFCRAIGLNKVEEDFDLFEKSELILRGLAKSKFRNLVKIVVNGKLIYYHPEKRSDLRKSIDNIREFEGEIKKGNNVEINAFLDDVEKCIVIIKIKRLHSKKERSIDILFKGRIKNSIYHTFLNYLNENIGVIEEK